MLLAKNRISALHRAQTVGAIQTPQDGGSFMAASAKQLDAKVKGLKERIDKKRKELAELTTQQKSLREQLAEAKKNEKGKAPAKKPAKKAAAPASSPSASS
jgi:hypothetical protein